MRILVRIGAILAEAVFLCLILVLPHLPFHDILPGSVIVWALLFVYVLWSLGPIGGDESGQKRMPLPYGLLSRVLYVLGGFSTLAGLFLFTVVIWHHLAYRTSEAVFNLRLFGQFPLSLETAGAGLFVSGAGLSLFLYLACRLDKAVLLPRLFTDSVVGCGGRVLIWLMPGLALFGIMLSDFQIASLFGPGSYLTFDSFGIRDAMIWGHESWPVRSKILFDFSMLLFLAWIGSIVLLMVHRRRMAGYGQGASAPCGRAIRGWFRGLGSAMRFAAALLVLLPPLVFTHAAMDVSMGLMPTYWAGSLTDSALNRWIKENREAGRDEREIAETLNRFGQWAPGTSGDGLGEIIPVAMRMLDKARLDKECRITISASVAEESDGPNLTYCMLATCPRPAVWSSRVTQYVATSHPPKSDYWNPDYWPMSLDGMAPRAVGYCNADGTLADTYQG